MISAPTSVARLRLPPLPTTGPWRLLLRVVGRLGTLLVVLLVVFATIDLLPGDGVRAALGRDATDAQVAAREAALGLDRPIPVRFGKWLAGLFSGDLGTSVRGTSVNEMLSTKFPNTLLLGGLALLVTAVTAVAFGALWSFFPRSLPARVLSAATIAVIAIPEFVIAVCLVFVFALVLGWLPAVTTTGPSGAPADAASLLLPVVALAIPQSGWNIRVTRSALDEAAQMPHVAAAELDGLTRREIILRHVLPIASPTIAASLATTVGMVLGGALVVETIFNYPGVGAVLAGAVTDRDAPVVAAVVALTGVVITGLLILADALRTWAVRGRA
ncbi:ABC transporter permease [Gordonia polyisoprenivorans]|uniref:ABC transporter permease n=1 Tax=Gordonia polyisoprenivorans TaxID=84595 RepID=UPI0023009400|nr:ABC transporter permease [Gordonia polyisoprenivorans]WCB36915.1 ABC transporter permease [Gordonia polyisoprenivorans]